MMESTPSICELFPAWCRETSRKRRRIEERMKHHTRPIDRNPSQSITNNKIVKEHPNKKVAFADEKSCVVHLCHYSSTDLHQSWYQPADFADFERSTQNTVEEFSKAGNNLTQIDPSRFCLRGLESQLSVDHVIKKKATQKALLEAVFEMQRSFHDRKDSNIEVIRVVSSVYSKRSSDDARLRGQMYADLESYI